MKTFLLVDDDEVFNFMNQKVLQRLGFTDVHAVSNGKQAVNFLKETCQAGKTLPDVIMLDLNMPVMDGFGFLKAFQDLDLPEKNKIKVMVLSSSINTQDMTMAKKLGAFKYQSKPLREENLAKMLELK